MINPKRRTSQGRKQTAEVGAEVVRGEEVVVAVVVRGGADVDSRRETVSHKMATIGHLVSKWSTCCGIEILRLHLFTQCEQKRHHDSREGSENVET